MLTDACHCNSLEPGTLSQRPSRSSIFVDHCKAYDVIVRRIHVMVHVVMTSILKSQIFYMFALCSSGFLDESQLSQPTVAHSSYLHFAGKWGEPKEVWVRSARRANAATSYRMAFRAPMRVRLCATLLLRKVTSRFDHSATPGRSCCSPATRFVPQQNSLRRRLPS